MSTDRRRLVLPLVIIAAIAVVVGLVGYFIVFLFAYGFSEGVHPAQHVAFLIGIAAISTFVGVIGWLASLALTPLPRLRHLGWSLAVSFAANFAVVAVGSIVSATHKDEGSVSADFSTTTDVLVASGLFGVALLSAVVAGLLARPRLARTA